MATKREINKYLKEIKNNFKTKSEDFQRSYLRGAIMVNPDDAMGKALCKLYVDMFGEEVRLKKKPSK